MTDLVDKIDSLQIKEDLFKDVKYFVTGNLEPRVKKIYYLNSLFL